MLQFSVTIATSSAFSFAFLFSTSSTFKNLSVSSVASLRVASSFFKPILSSSTP
jgi:hypothetical protein